MPLVCLVTPALADANNGNWQTARRWARMLSGHYRVRIAQTWTGKTAEDQADDGLLALHARRSADAVAAWATLRPGKPLVVALTGTDLYRDIQTDANAQRSLQLAERLIVLQDQGPLALPAALRKRCRVVLQSSTQRKTLEKTQAHLRAVMVGHLREEKSPQTLFDAARALRADEGILLYHIGRSMDGHWGEAAQATMTSAAARKECRGAHTVNDYERAADDAEFPLGRNDKEWMKHTLWHSADNSLSYKPVNLKPLTVESIPPKVRTF